jgi:nucleoside-diphosphate-sugar epimerase
LKILLLGGPRFLGRAVADAALARAHELAFFNRGQTSPDLYPDVEKLHGDRDGGLGALAGREWDAVVDTSGYVPRIVGASAASLQPHIGRYVFVSSISVYADLGGPVDEGSPVGTLADETVEEMGEEHENYGPLKALCEKTVQRVFGDRALIVRPGLIVGPHDPTGRFTYWAHRLARGGEVLAPAPPERRVQFIDVRDLADWIIASLENGLGGVFNATSEGVPWADVVAGADVTWLDDSFLVEQGVGEWMELPLWVSSAEWAGIHEADVSRAVAAGLCFRPVAETMADTLTEAELVDGVGLSPAREAGLLASWHAR